MTVYLNGEYLPKSEAKISVDDRGFLLSDGVYEVTPFYGGVAFGLDRHLERLGRGLAFLRIDCDASGLEEVHSRLIAENGLGDADRSIVYLQITRGVAPRTHYFPTDPVPPTVYAFAKAWARDPDDVWEAGYRAATVPDERWSRADVKTICLLPNVLAYQAAIDAGAEDAILVRDGVAVEGAHHNFWGVFEGTLVTHPTNHRILPGITRGFVLEIAAELGIPVEERPIAAEELETGDEFFFTGTTREVRPCTQIDGRVVGSGRVGPVTRRVSDAFLARIELTKEAAGAAAR